MSFSVPNPEPLNAQSRAVLKELKEVTDQVRAQEQATLTGLQNQQEAEASGLVTLMWFGVGTVSVITILFQLIVANSIIGPIQHPGGRGAADAKRRLQGPRPASLRR